MAEPTREEKCRVLAEWLGWTWNAVCPYKEKEAEWTIQHDNGCWTFIENGHAVHGTHLPDFYTSEEASALLLEKMPNPRLERCETDGEYYWSCVADRNSRAFPMWDKDRKTAIAEAAYVFVMQSKHATNA